ncbi:hypothetical protein Tco_1166196 [Tanacetum coccineum]
MITITISWFLVCEVGEAFKDMIEHETHFIPNFMDEGLSALAMGTSGMEGVWRVENMVEGSDDGGGSTCEIVLVLSNLFNDLFTGHEGFRMGTKSTISPIEVGWWKEGVNDSLDEMSMMLVRATFLGGFLVEEEALEAIFRGE